MGMNGDVHCPAGQAARAFRRRVCPQPGGMEGHSGHAQLSEVLREGKYARAVAARSLLCYWANRELGITTVAGLPAG